MISYKVLVTSQYSQWFQELWYGLILVRHIFLHPPIDNYSKLWWVLINVQCWDYMGFILTNVFIQNSNEQSLIRKWVMHFLLPLVFQICSFQHFLGIEFRVYPLYSTNYEISYHLKTSMDRKVFLRNPSNTPYGYLVI